MSKGNVNTSGNKKNNFPYQQSVLLLLDVVAKASSTAGLAQESTLISVLNAIVASDQDIEVLLVRDEAVGNGDPVLKQVTNYQTGVPVITYENVDGTTYVPAPNPVPVYVYLDPSAVLQLMLAELVLLNAGGQLLTEATFVAEDFATETTLAAINAKLNSLGQKVSASSVPVVLSTEQEVILGAIKTAVEAIDIDTNGLSTEATLLATNALLTAIDTVLDNILLDTTAIKGYLVPTARTITTLRVVTITSGNIPAGARSASFYNAHATANATIAGTTLKPGEAISFDAGAQGDTLPQINWTTLVAADFLITSVV